MALISVEIFKNYHVHVTSQIWKFFNKHCNRRYWLLSHRYIDQNTGDKLTLREAARAGLLAMVGAPVAAIMEAMRARQSMSRSPSRERTLSPQSTLRSNMSSRDVSFDTDRQVEINFNKNIKVCLHIPTPSPSPSIVYIVSKVTGRMGVEPILPVRLPVTTGTIIKLDGDGDGVGMCKHVKKHL